MTQILQIEGLTRAELTGLVAVALATVVKSQWVTGPEESLAIVLSPDDAEMFRLGVLHLLGYSSIAEFAHDGHTVATFQRIVALREKLAELGALLTEGEQEGEEEGGQQR